MVILFFLADAATEAVGVYNKNELDGDFMMKLMIALTFLGNGAAIWLGLKRKPSLDVDLTKLSEAITTLNANLANAHTDIEKVRGYLSQTDQLLAATRNTVTGMTEKMSAVKEDIEEIRERLSDGDEVMSMLREKQAENAAVITAIKSGQHEQYLAIDGVRNLVTQINHKMPRTRS